MSKEDYQLSICDIVEEQKLEKIGGYMTDLNKEHQLILDKITHEAHFYNIDSDEWHSDKPDTMTFFYTKRGLGALIAGRIGDFMHGNYPNQDYEIRMRTSEVEVSLL